MIPALALSFKQMTTHQQISFSKNLITKMTKDRRFQSLLPTVKELTKFLTEWQISIIQAKGGNKNAALLKMEKGKVVMDKVFSLATQVEVLAEHDKSIIQASGYQRPAKISFHKMAFSQKQIEEFLLAVA